MNKNIIKSPLNLLIKYMNEIISLIYFIITSFTKKEYRKWVQDTLRMGLLIFSFKQPCQFMPLEVMFKARFT